MKTDVCRVVVLIDWPLCLFRSVARAFCASFSNWFARLERHRHSGAAGEPGADVDLTACFIYTYHWCSKDLFRVILRRAGDG